MNSSACSDYLLLSRGQWDTASSKADIEAAIDQFYAWYEANLAKGIFKPGSRLTTDAAMVTRDGISTDGPFAEGILPRITKFQNAEVFCKAVLAGTLLRCDHH